MLRFLPFFSQFYMLIQYIIPNSTSDFSSAQFTIFVLL